MTIPPQLIPPLVFVATMTILCLIATLYEIRKANKGGAITTPEPVITDDLREIADSLDETCGMLIKDSELKRQRNRWSQTAPALAPPCSPRETSLLPA
jgi:hypothetical protein